MTLEIKFSTSIYISGKDLSEIKEKFINIPLYHPETSKKCEFVEVELVTRVDDSSYKEYTFEFEHAEYDEEDDEYEYEDEDECKNI